MKAYYVRLVQWIVKMNSDEMTDKHGQDQHQIVLHDSQYLRTKSDMIREGLDMATELKRNVKTLIFMHQQCGRDLSEKRLQDIMNCLEFIKAIEVQFRMKRSTINQWVILINRETREKIDLIIQVGIQRTGKWYSKGQFYEDMMFLLGTAFASH